MQRYYQTMTRILAGFVCLSMLAWFLWPRDADLLDREEALFAFIIALAVWILTEIKESDEIIYRAATKNDIRLAREIVSYASDKFRSILKEQDFAGSFWSQHISELNLLLNEYEIGVAFFQDRRVAPFFDDFCRELKTFSRFITIHSSPTSQSRSSIIPRDFSGDISQFKSEAKEANRLAKAAWDRLLPLVSSIRTRIPEAFDEPITYEWFRSASIYDQRTTDRAQQS